jgi:AraC-like DNA-binding protein
LTFCAELFGDGQQNRKPERIRDGGLVRASGVMRFHSMPSAGGGIARLVSARMRELGVQLVPLLSRAGLTVEQIDNRSARLKVPSQIKFLELSATASQDDCLGFHLARDFDLREIGLLYYVLASSEILADALHKAERYSGIVNEGISLRFSERHKTAITFSYVGVERRSDRHQIEFWLTSLVRLCRQLTNRRLVPSQIRVMHNRTKTPAEFRSFLGCEIEFGSNVDEVVFPEAVKLMPIGSADPHLNELLTKCCDEALAHREPNRTNLRSSVENAIALLLPHGKARASEIARGLGMSHRTLARRLALEGLTFSGILDELKVDLAKGYLKDGNLPISQIAWLLGYREVGALTHAFKRWTGSTPRTFRAQKDFPSTDDRTRRRGAQALPRR